MKANHELRAAMAGEGARLRPLVELERAHGLFLGIVKNPGLVEALTPDVLEYILERLDILCWVLGHPNRFGVELAQIYRSLAAASIDIDALPLLGRPEADGGAR